MLCFVLNNDTTSKIHQIRIMICNFIGVLKFSTKAEKAFISEGVKYWATALRKFKKHQNSDCHKEVIMKNNATKVKAMLDPAYVKQQHVASDMLLKIVETIYFLCRQGLGLRGTSVAGNVDVEPNSNFIQSLRLRAIDDPRMLDWLSQKGNKFTSPEIQNSIIKIIAHDVLRSTLKEVKKAVNYTILVDETTDISNHEQAVFCVRWVGADFIPREHCLGLYKLSNTKSETILQMIKDVLLRCDLKLSDMRGQCYDGAASMKGHNKGVAAQILQEEPRATYIHCFGHSLNLAVQDLVRSSRTLRDCLDFSYELIKLVKKSPRREALLLNIKETMEDASSTSIRTLCPTR